LLAPSVADKKGAEAPEGQWISFVRTRSGTYDQGRDCDDGAGHAHLPFEAADGRFETLDLGFEAFVLSFEIRRRISDLHSYVFL